MALAPHAQQLVDDQQDRLSEIEAPVLCLWGMNDKFCPASGAMKIAERCKNSRTVLVSECGHWVMIEAKEAFEATVRAFLTR
mgnify:CR=1 FL=1